MKKHFTIKQIKKTNLKDTFFGTYFYRKTATYFTYFLVRTPLTPNKISFLSLIATIAGAVSYSFGTYQGFIWGCILIQVGMILDYSDGQVARLTNRGTKRGAWLDVVLGMIQNNILLLGITLGLIKNDPTIIPWILGFVVLFAWNMTCYVHLNAMIFFPNLELKSTRAASSVKKKVAIKPQYLSIGSDVYFVIIGLTSLVGLLSYGLMVLSVIGNLYWIAVAVFMFKSTKDVK